MPSEQPLPTKQGAELNEKLRINVTPEEMADAVLRRVRVDRDLALQFSFDMVPFASANGNGQAFNSFSNHRALRSSVNVAA